MRPPLRVPRFPHLPPFLALPPLRSIHPIRRSLEIVRAALIGFARNGTGDQAAALAFISLLSLVPLAAAFSVLLSTFFGGDRWLAEAIAGALPAPSQKLVDSFRSLVEHSRAVSGIGTALFFVVGFRAYLRIETAVNRVWHIHSPRRLSTRIGAFLVMMFWGPLVLGVLFNLRLALRVPTALPGVGEHLEEFGTGAAFIATALALTMIHWKGPNARVRFLPALGGGAAAAAGAYVIRLAVAHPWQFLKDLDVVYGSLAILVLVLVGLQAFWTWFLFTVELTHAWQRSGRTPARRFGYLPPPEEDAVMAMRIAAYVAVAYRNGDPPRDTDQWSEYLDVPADDLDRVVLKLAQAGILENDPTSGWIRPARDPARTTLADAWVAAAVERNWEGPASGELREVERSRMELLRAKNLYGEELATLEPEGR